MKLSKEAIKSYVLSLLNDERPAFVEELRDIKTTARNERIHSW